jgi:hypothetical protein
MARKTVTKKSSQPPAAILTPEQQKQINLDWEQSTGTPAGRRKEDINVTQEYFNEWGGKGSSLKTNESRGGWTKSGLGAGESKAIGKLPIRKISASASKSDMIQKPKKTVPVEVKYKKEIKVKRQTAGGKMGSRIVSNAKATAKNIVGPAKFKREEKLAGAYERNKAGLSQMSSKEKVADLKGQRKYLRSSEMKKTAGMTPQKLKEAKKGLRQAEKYVKKEASGKVKYFTQAALGKTMEVTDSKSKTKSKKIQAGKVRYS